MAQIIKTIEISSPEALIQQSGYSYKYANRIIDDIFQNAEIQKYLKLERTKSRGRSF